MAYTYNFFSKQLINGGDKINLSDVFTEIQDEAKKALNLGYGLGDIVLYLQDVTQDFTRAERQYVDLDQAIQSIVFKYYKYKNEKNPFKSNETRVVQLEEGPREAVVIKEGKSKAKGAAKSAKSIFKVDEPPTKAKEAAPAPVPEAVVSEVSVPINEDEEIVYLKELLNQAEEDKDDDPDTIENIASQTMVAFGALEQDKAREWYKANGFNYDKYNQ